MDEAIEKATQAHIHTLIMNGTVTVNKPNTGRDIKDYLQSGKFLQFQSSLHYHAAKELLKVRLVTDEGVDNNG